MSKCSIDGCAKPVNSRGYCVKHYQSLLRRGTLLPIVRKRKKCTVEGCDRYVHGHSYCLPHYKRWRKWGDPLINKNPRENHGLSKSSEYYSWCCMKSRCTYPTFPKYEYYGGRGIKVCSGLYRSFTSFVKLLGVKPDKSYTIDRKNSDGHYSCGECEKCIMNGWPMNIRWATMHTQGINQRLRATNKSGYRGVSLDKFKSMWVAQITSNNKNHFLGYYKDPKGAARAYNRAAINYHGKDAQLNIIENGKAA